MSQVVTISPEGVISGLQVKPGKGLDLTKIGKASVERVSLVEWSEEHQGWFVQIIRGPKAGTVLTRAVWAAAGLREHLEDPGNSIAARVAEDGTLLFVDYDDGVRAEIMYLDKLRLQGVF